ncbi:hypothetical protein SLEP1_g5223 [Rubroshorea leprosula]|uniref:Secreted protein n=1 Tax=Rubroshorea leprosula TaxID=152421 RepID=A0AAV5HZ59_9ROSI|nr:hypothetical protein SLEP1_g5223 [Rubroshorea leprosula]
MAELLLIFILRSLWGHRILVPVPSRAWFSEIFCNEFFSKIRILSLDKVVQTLSVGKIFLETIGCDHIQAPAFWKIHMLAYLSH